DDEIESLSRMSHGGLIPPVVFRLAKPQLAHFLRLLFDAGGRMSLTRGRVVRISYSTVSERLARQLQHLLLRFGVIAKLGKGSMDNEPGGGKSWKLEITDAHSFIPIY